MHSQKSNYNMTRPLDPLDGSDEIARVGLISSKFGKILTRTVKVMPGTNGHTELIILATENLSTIFRSHRNLLEATHAKRNAPHVLKLVECILIIVGRYSVQWPVNMFLMNFLL